MMGKVIRLQLEVINELLLHTLINHTETLYEMVKCHLGAESAARLLQLPNIEEWSRIYTSFISPKALSHSESLNIY